MRNKTDVVYFESDIISHCTSIIYSINFILFYTNWLMSNNQYNFYHVFY